MFYCGRGLSEGWDAFPLGVDEENQPYAALDGEKIIISDKIWKSILTKTHKISSSVYEEIKPSRIEKYKKRGFNIINADDLNIQTGSSSSSSCNVRT